jgi:molecular chaperone GrpE
MVKGKKIEIRTDEKPEQDLEEELQRQTEMEVPGSSKEAESEEAEPEKEAPKNDDLEERLIAAEEEARANYDRYVRLAAEFDNFRKRSAREMDDYRRFANESLVKELLPVVDNLERALLSAENPAAEENGLKEGVELTLREILRVLDKFGVKPIQSLNEPFNPAYHQAMMQEPRENVPENTVISEMQKGYMLQDRLLRPAMVIVSAPKSADETSAGDAGS